MAKIRVSQSDGEVSVARDGNVHEPTIYKVKDGTVSVPDADAAHFLSVVGGSEAVGGQRAAAALIESSES